MSPGPKAASPQSGQSFSTAWSSDLPASAIKFAQEKPYPAVISLSDHRDPRIRALQRSVATRQPRGASMIGMVPTRGHERSCPRPRNRGVKHKALRSWIIDSPQFPFQSLPEFHRNQAGDLHPPPASPDNHTGHCLELKRQVAFNQRYCSAPTSHMLTVCSPLAAGPELLSQLKGCKAPTTRTPARRTPSACPLPVFRRHSRKRPCRTRQRVHTTCDLNLQHGHLPLFRCCCEGRSLRARLLFFRCLRLREASASPSASIALMIFSFRTGGTGTS